MKNFKQAILIILALSLCLSLTACGIGGGDESTPKPQESPTPTVGSTPTEASTPQPVEPSSPESNAPSSPETNEPSTPEASVPATPPASSPETSGNDPQGKESDPVGKESVPEVSDTVPVESTPALETPNDPLPVATDDLTAEQMAEIEKTFGKEIDWDKLYFGTYDGYVIFGVTDDSGKYYETNGSAGIIAYGFTSCVYAYKNGTVVEFKEIESKLSMNDCYRIPMVAARKTMDYFPDIDTDLTEAEQKAFKETVAKKFIETPRFYGKYNGYVVFGIRDFLYEDSYIVVHGRTYWYQTMHAYLINANNEIIPLQDALKQGLIADRDVINTVLIAVIDIYYEMVDNNPYA